MGQALKIAGIAIVGIALLTGCTNGNGANEVTDKAYMTIKAPDGFTSSLLQAKASETDLMVAQSYRSFTSRDGKCVASKEMLIVPENGEAASDWPRNSYKVSHLSQFMRTSTPHPDTLSVYSIGDEKNGTETIKIASDKGELDFTRTKIETAHAQTKESNQARQGYYAWKSYDQTITVSRIGNDGEKISQTGKPVFLMSLVCETDTSTDIEKAWGEVVAGAQVNLASDEVPPVYSRRDGN